MDIDRETTRRFRRSTQDVEVRVDYLLRGDLAEIQASRHEAFCIDCFRADGADDV